VPARRKCPPMGKMTDRHLRPTAHTATEKLKKSGTVNYLNRSERFVPITPPKRPSGRAVIGGLQWLHKPSTIGVEDTSSATPV
jgi:hypothetical protein